MELKPHRATARRTRARASSPGMVFTRPLRTSSRRRNASAAQSWRTVPSSAGSSSRRGDPRAAPRGLARERQRFFGDLLRVRFMAARCQRNPVWASARRAMPSGPTTGNNSFFTACDAGKWRGPSPATGMTALRMGFMRRIKRIFNFRQQHGRAKTCPAKNEREPTLPGGVSAISASISSGGLNDEPPSRPSRTHDMTTIRSEKMSSRKDKASSNASDSVWALSEAKWVWHASKPTLTSCPPSVQM